MSAFQIEVTISAGRVTDNRAELADLIRQLPDGKYSIAVKAVGKVKATRYKYYFDCVMWYLLQHARKFYLMTNPETGEQYNPRTVDEMHLICKTIYNPRTVTHGRFSITIPASTTELSDREFIGNYLETIIFDHANAPYNIEIPTFEDWAALHRAGAWSQIKRQ